jgi:hypothetical protein
MVSPAISNHDGEPHYAPLSEFFINQAVADWHCFVSEFGPIERKRGAEALAIVCAESWEHR